ncbi:MAG: DUF4214 domain-containing protein [Telluria sp.]
MSALGSLVVKLALDYAEYTKGLDKSDQDALKFAQNAQKNFDQAGAAIGGFLKGAVIGAAGAVTALVSVSSVIDGMKASIDSLAKLDDMAQKTGSSIENLSRLQRVAVAFGQDFGAVDSAVDKLAKGMGELDGESNKTHGALARLGVSAKDAAGKLRDPSAVLIEVSKSLAGYKDGAAKTALMNDLLGKSGADLVPYLNDVAEHVDKFAPASARAVKGAVEFQDRMGFVNEKVDRLKLSLAEALLPSMGSLAEAFVDVTNAKNGLVDDKASKWADDLAVDLASLADTGIMLFRTFGAIGGSVGVVASNVRLLFKIMEEANPVNAALTVARGGSPNDNIKAAFAQHDKVLASADKRYELLLNEPIDKLEKAVLARIAERIKAEAAAAGKKPAVDNRPDLGNTPGGSNPPPAASRAAGRAGSSAAALGDFDKMNKSLQEKLALQEREIELGRALTDTEAQILKLYADRSAGTTKLSNDEMALLEASIIKVGVNQQLISDRTAADKADKDAIATNQQKVVAANESLAAMQAEVAMYGKLPSAITLANVAALEGEKNRLALKGGKEEEIRVIEALIDVNKRLAGAQSNKEDLEAARKAGEELDAFLDPTKAQSFGDALKGAFGAAGDSMTKLIGSLDSYGIKQAEIEKARKNAATAYAGDSVKLAAANKAITEKEVKSRIGAYGDMAGAAKGFFKEGSGGYRALEAAERTFRGVETALAIESMMTKSGLLTAFTGLFVSAKATEAATEVGSLGVTATVETAKQGIFGTTALAAALALPFPANLPAFAIVAAMLASIGVAVAGGSGGGSKAASTTFEDRQKTQGAGTVLGDESAKSASIASSLEIMEANSKLELGYQNSMLTALKNIESALGGAAKGIFQTTGLTGGSAFGTVNESKSSFFGTDSSTTITDTGIRFSGSLGDLRAGAGRGVQYEDVTRKSDGGWFHGDSVSSSTNTKALGDAAMKPFTLIFDSMGALLVGAGAKLGQDSAGLTAAINQIGVEFAVSTRDLKGQDLVDALSAGVSVAFDKVAAAVFPGMEQFQKVGEGMGETLIRVAANYASLDTIFASVGLTFGAVGFDSLAARERLIELSGGIDALAQKTSFFADNFLTEAERMAPVQKMVVDQLAALGFASIATRDEFKSLVMGLDRTTETGARTHAALMDLAPAFADVYPEIEATTAAIAAQTDAQRTAASGLMESVNAAFSVLQRVANAEKGRIAEAHAITMKGLQQRMDAESKAITISKARSDLLNGSIDQMRMAGTDALQRSDAQAQIRAALLIARAGGPLPAADSLRGPLSVLTRDSRNMFASLEDYQRDFDKTRNDLVELAKMSDAALSIEEQTLAVLQRQKDVAQKSYDVQIAYFDDLVKNEQLQIDILNGIDTTGLSIVDAIEALHGALLGAMGDNLAGSAAGINSAYKSALGRAPDPAGMKFWQDQVAGGASVTDVVDAITKSPEARLQGMYQATLGRPADAAGLQFWLKQMAGGTPFGDVQSALSQSDEFTKKLRGFAVGANFIPTDMPAMLHEGERVIPAADNRELMARLSNPGNNNAELVAEVRALRTELAGSRAEQRATATHCEKLTRQLGEVIRDNAVITREETP